MRRLFQMGVVLASCFMVGCGGIATPMLLAGGQDSATAQALRQNDETYFSILSNFDDIDAANEEADPTPPGPSKRTLITTNKDGSTTTHVTYMDGSQQVTRVGKNGVTTEDVRYSAPMAASASVNVPPDAQTWEVKIAYVRTPNGSTGTGYLLRTFEQKKLYRSEASETLKTPQGDNVLRTRLAEAYLNNHAGHTLVTAQSKRGNYELDTVLNPQTGVKVGNGKLIRPDGSIVTTVLTENPDKSKVRVTEDTKIQQRTTLKFAIDKSGTGTIENLATNPPTQIATIQWDTTGKGLITYNDGTTKKFRA